MHDVPPASTGGRQRSLHVAERLGDLVLERRRDPQVVVPAALPRDLDAVADAPYAVPGTVLAIAVFLVFLPPLPLIGVSLYGTLWLILAAYLARFEALCHRLGIEAEEMAELR